MDILAAFFFGSLLLGQVGGISLWPGVVVYVQDGILAIAAFGILVYHLKKKNPAPKLLLPIGLFTGAAVVSLVVNSGNFTFPVLGISSLYLVRWLLYIVAYVWALRLLRVNFWVYGLFLLGMGFAVLGFIQFFLYPDLRNLTYLGWDPHYYRLFSTLLDPNFTGLMLVLSMILGLTFWKNIKNRWWMIVGELIAGIALLLTYSRSSFLALAAAVIIGVLLTKRWKLLIGLVLLGIAVTVTPRTSGSTLSILRADTVLARIGNWQDGMTLIEKSPIFGHGFNTLRFIQGNAASPIISKSASGLDSSMLFIGATTGILGIVAYGYLLFSMMKLAWHKKVTTLHVVYMSSLGALLVHSLFVNSMFYPWVLIWMWILTGVVEKTN